MQQEKLEHFKIIMEVLNDVSGNLSDAYKGLISDGLAPRYAKTICMIYVKEAFTNID